MISNGLVADAHPFRNLLGRIVLNQVIKHFLFLFRTDFLHSIPSVVYTMQLF